MRQTAKTYFKVLQIIDLVVGILCCITIIGAILGVPLIMASNKFRDAYDMNDKELILNRGSIFGWGIFSAVILAGSIFGLIIVLILAITVNDFILSLEKEGVAEKSFSDSVKESTSNIVGNVKESFGVKSDLDKEKEKLQKLKVMRDEGLITEEEYQQKRRQILGI